MNPYDILGVPKDADEETIRQAYRRLSRKAHPDRHGGDTKAMVALNVARDILTDPARRERYDLGGEDIPPVPPVELRARMQLAMAFMQLAQQPERVNIPKAAARFLAERIRNLSNEMSEFKQMKQRLQNRLKDVECDDEVNVFADQLNSAIRQIEDQQKNREETIEAVRRAQEILKKYRSDVKDEIAPFMFRMTGI